MPDEFIHGKNGSSYRRCPDLEAGRECKSCTDARRAADAQRQRALRARLAAGSPDRTSRNPVMPDTGSVTRPERDRARYGRDASPESHAPAPEPAQAALGGPLTPGAGLPWTLPAPAPDGPVGERWEPYHVEWLESVLTDLLPGNITMFQEMEEQNEIDIKQYGDLLTYFCESTGAIQFEAIKKGLWSRRIIKYKIWLSPEDEGTIEPDPEPEYKSPIIVHPEITPKSRIRRKQLRFAALNSNTNGMCAIYLEDESPCKNAIDGHIKYEAFDICGEHMLKLNANGYETTDDRYFI